MPENKRSISRCMARAIYNYYPHRQRCFCHIHPHQTGGGCRRKQALGLDVGLSHICVCFHEGTCCVTTTIYSKKEPAFYLVIHFFLSSHTSLLSAHGFWFYFPSISSRESLARHTGAESVKKIPMTIIQTSKSPPEIMPNGIPNHNLITLVRFWLKRLDRSLTSILRQTF